jgi:hypothetical protein
MEKKNTLKGKHRDHENLRSYALGRSPFGKGIIKKKANLVKEFWKLTKRIINYQNL